MQLNMNFTDANPLREKLESAEFVFLLEYELPAEDENLSTIYENINGALKKYVFTDTLHTKVIKNIHGDSSGVRGAAWLS